MTDTYPVAKHVCTKIRRKPTTGLVGLSAVVRVNSFITFAKFSERLTFFAP